MGCHQSKYNKDIYTMDDLSDHKMLSVNSHNKNFLQQVEDIIIGDKYTHDQLDKFNRACYTYRLHYDRNIFADVIFALINGMIYEMSEMTKLMNDEYNYVINIVQFTKNGYAKRDLQSAMNIAIRRKQTYNNRSLKYFYRDINDLIEKLSDTEFYNNIVKNISGGMLTNQDKINLICDLRRVLTTQTNPNAKSLLELLSIGTK